MTHSKNLTPTFALMKKLSPLIQCNDLDTYEKKFGYGNFDVMCKQQEGEKTIFGDEEIDFSSSTLRELANNLYDYFYEGYEVWIRETPEIVNGETKMTEDSMRYAIALEADNIDEDEAILSCRIVSGWLVLSAVYDATVKQRRKFYISLGMNHHFKENGIFSIGPNSDDWFRLRNDEVENLTKQKVLKFTIKHPKNSSCPHCEKKQNTMKEKLKEYREKETEENYFQIQEMLEKLNSIKDHITKSEFNEKMKTFSELNSYFSERYEKYISLEEEYENALEEDVTLYKCNLCKKITCELMYEKRVCYDCKHYLFDSIAKEKNYDLEI